ncbi:hypothetical protein F3J37_01280 [Pantoea sp. Al-1710]|uniref:Uncharacterized protein n=1 Tax=Candidatus Pantoea communis TaxID=2608354 RepID=A0ABX0RNK1_9GAMM|nr:MULTISPECIES: hypothetical protein [Pantoea]NIG12990.1 hypothetical protein [Pantoea sp. Cy-640]NIG17309.1 hypothetical protein [Pantoea communis]
MRESEKKKLAMVRNELLQAKALLEEGNAQVGLLSVISAIAFVDMIYTIQRPEHPYSSKSIR